MGAAVPADQLRDRRGQARQRDHEVDAQDADGEHVEDAAERRPGGADDRGERVTDLAREVGDELPDLGRDVGVPEGVAEPVVAPLQVGDISRQRCGELRHLPGQHRDQQRHEQGHEHDQPDEDDGHRPAPADPQLAEPLDGRIQADGQHERDQREEQHVGDPPCGGDHEQRGDDGQRGPHPVRPRRPHLRPRRLSRRRGRLRSRHAGGSGLRLCGLRRLALARSAGPVVSGAVSGLGDHPHLLVQSPRR